MRPAKILIKKTYKNNKKNDDEIWYKTKKPKKI